MKRFLLFSTMIFLFWAQDSGVNSIEEVIVAPEFIAFKTKATNANLWTIQTISRNFDIFAVTIKERPESVVMKDNIPVKYYKKDSTMVYFSKWSTEIEKDSLILSELSKFNIEKELNLKEKLSMIAYLNRKKLDFIEDFFRKTFVVGANSVSTSLDNPINLIDYNENRYLYYIEKAEVNVVLPGRKYRFPKSDYDWEYKDKKIYLFPTKDYIKRKPIAAIATGRSWYNNNWEKLRKKKKLYAIIDESGFKWNTTGLEKAEQNLVDWFKKN